MNLIFSDYFTIFIFIFFAILLSIILYVLSYFLASKNADLEKLSAYECGFDPFEDARSKFDIRFYLVGILFIIFDLEVAFLFPWAIVLGKIGIFGF